MNHDKKRKTFVFSSPGNKAFCDAAFRAKSKETGIPSMRLIENAILEAISFRDTQITEWCLTYNDDVPSRQYVCLAGILKGRGGILPLYQLICRHTDIPMDAVLPKLTSTDVPVTVSVTMAVERAMEAAGEDHAYRAFCDFVFDFSAQLDGMRIPLDSFMPFLRMFDRDDTQGGNP